MARSRNRRRSTSYSRKRRNSFSRSKGRVRRRNDLTTLAYKMGQVNRGLKNPDSLIAESYNRGATKPHKREKKSLF